MSAILIAIGVVLAAQVTSGGGGRYSNTPPAKDLSTEFGGLLASEPATAPSAIGGSATGTAPSGTIGKPAATNGPLANPLTERPAIAAPSAPPSAYNALPRQGPSGTTQGSVYGNSATTPSVSPPLERRSTSDAAALMKAMLTRPSNSRLSGEAIRLAEVVQGAGGRAEQTARVEAYWDLCSAVADYYLGLIEQQELAHLERQKPTMSAPLRQANAALQTRVATAERSARAAQMRLASLMGRSTGANLALPADMPHCGEYITRYEEKFGDNGSAEAAELNALLPLRHAELEAATDAVMRSEEWINAVAAQGDGTAMLRALELFALHRRAFVQIARDYNRKITRYSELATPGRLATGRLVAMLIRTSDATAVAQRTSEASRTAPRNDTPRTVVPQTFVAPPNTPSVPGTIQPLSGEYSPTPADELPAEAPPGNNFVLPIEN